MSHIVVNNIVGTGTYAVPTSDAELSAARSGLAALLAGVSGLEFSRVLATVTTSGGVGATRRLCALVEQYQYNGEENPSAAEVGAMAAAIELALLADANITSIGALGISNWQADSMFLWTRPGGILGPVTGGDTLKVQGYYSGAAVFTGTAPAYGQLVDLSAYVGVRRARVFLDVASTLAQNVAVEAYGAGLDLYKCLQSATISANSRVRLTTETDAQGRIGIIGESKLVTVTLLDWHNMVTL